MILNKNQTVFPSTAQKSIWHTLMFMSPFYEIISPDIGNSRSEILAQGEKDFYDFMSFLYLDMYNNPAKYYIPTAEYDKYMKGRKKEDLPHKNDPKECSLRNKFQNSIKFYQDFFYEIGRNGELDLESFNFIITEDKFLDVIKKFKILKNDENKFIRINVLKSLGFDYRKNDKKIIFFNNKYPMMFTGLSALSKSKNPRYGYTCFLLCDFRGLNNFFEFKFNDTVSVLNKKYKKTAFEMNKTMEKIDTRLKIKPLRNSLLNSLWKLQYTKKGKAVYTMHIDIDVMNNFLYFNNIENISKIGYLLKKQYVDLFNWYYDNFKVMECACRNNRIADIGGRKKRICGLMNRLEIKNPTKVDLERMKKVLEIYHFENLI